MKTLATEIIADLAKKNEKKQKLIEKVNRIEDEEQIDYLLDLIEKDSAADCKQSIIDMIEKINNEKTLQIICDFVRVPYSKEREGDNQHEL